MGDWLSGGFVFDLEINHALLLFGPLEITVFQPQYINYVGGKKIPHTLTGSKREIMYFNTYLIMLHDTVFNFYFCGSSTFYITNF